MNLKRFWWYLSGWDASVMLTRRFWVIVYLHWKHRDKDPEVCCCGCYMGKGGSICYHGGCRSMKEYIITCDLERFPCKKAKENHKQ